MARRRKTYRSQPPRSRRVAEPTVSTTMRLRRSVRQGLESLAERSRRSVSDLAEELIAEGMRMRECPGIYFATEPSGRTAKVAGSGLAVWEVLRDFVEDDDAAGLREAFHWLSPAQLTAAAMYFRRYPDEVRGQVEANRALTPEAVEKLWPGLVRIAPAG
jgi:uncharacterized protein (DUF433 family)